MTISAGRVLCLGLLLGIPVAWAQMGPCPSPPCGGMGMGMMGQQPGRAGMSMVRHRYVMMNGIPAPYAGTSHPSTADTSNVVAGKSLFETACASCHGPAGRGDGPAAKDLNPAPSNLTAVVHMPIASDAYLLWTVSEGGAPVGSAMPAFKDSLSREQIWQLVSYLRTLE